MDKIIRDFHCHSNCSDGFYSPSDLIKHANIQNVKELSLTDHDTIIGQEIAINYCDKYRIGYLPGVEISCKYKDKIIHILCYGFDLDKMKSNKKLMDYFQSIRKSNLNWAYEVCKESQKNPLKILYKNKEISVSIFEDEINQFKGTLPSYFHHALLLSEKFKKISRELGRIPPRHIMYTFFGKGRFDQKHYSYWPGLIDKYLDLYRKYNIEILLNEFTLENEKLIKAYWWCPRASEDYLEYTEVLDLIASLNACSVLAHPLEQCLNKEDIKEMANKGLTGLEVYTSKHTSENIKALAFIADELKLIKTGGTDYHGPAHRAKVELGRNKSGNILTKGFDINDFINSGYKTY